MTSTKTFNPVVPRTSHEFEFGIQDTLFVWVVDYIRIDY